MNNVDNAEAIIRETRLFHATNDMEGMIGFVAALHALDSGIESPDDEEVISDVLDPETPVGAFALQADREFWQHGR
jgi:hypothetical protein